MSGLNRTEVEEQENGWYGDQSGSRTTGRAKNMKIFIGGASAGGGMDEHAEGQQ